MDPESETSAEQGCRVRVRVGWMQSQRLAEPESDVDAETSRARVRCRVICGCRVRD